MMVANLQKGISFCICVVIIVMFVACGYMNEPPIILSEEEKMLYKPVSLTVSLYDVQNSVYGFTFNTINEPLAPVIQIKKIDDEMWSEYALSSEEYFSYTREDEIFNYYVSKIDIPLELPSNCI